MNGLNIFVIIFIDHNRDLIGLFNVITPGTFIENVQYSNMNI